jgi:alpha-glucosidase
LDRGIDGFRIDAVAHLIKDPRWRDNPPNPDFKPDGMPPTKRQIPAFLRDQPDVHGVIAWLRQMTDLYGDRILIGETYLSPGRLLSYYGSAGLNFPFNFKLIETEWNPTALRAAIDSYEAMLASDDWPSWVLGNHDRPRIATRIGRDKLRLAAMLLLTLRGTPTLYYGDEIGMRDVPLEPSQVLDPRGKAMPGYGRDPARTPMQWNDRRAAGFSDGKPWLPVSPDFAQCNVAQERAGADSLLGLYRRLLELRGREAALQVGDYRPVPLHENAVAYERSFADRRLLVILNFGSQRLTVDLPPDFVGGRQVLASATRQSDDELGQSIEVPALEGIIIAP